MDRPDLEAQAEKPNRPVPASMIIPGSANHSGQDTNDVVLPRSFPASELDQFGGIGMLRIPKVPDAQDVGDPCSLGLLAHLRFEGGPGVGAKGV